MEHVKWCKVCNKLYRKYNMEGEKEFEKLPSNTDECCGEPLIELDKPIAETIQIMNAKGYETIYSCAGHVDHIEGALVREHTTISSLYVVFCPTKNHEKALAFLLNNVPLGFKLSYHKPAKYANPDAYPYTIVLEPDYPVDDDDQSPTISYYMKHRAMADYLARNTLYVWAKEFLPDLNEN